VPIVSIQCSSAEITWTPKEIDAYHAIKIKDITIIITFTAVGTGVVGIGLDEEPNVTSNNEVRRSLSIYSQAAEANSFVIPYSDLDSIVGDQVRCMTNSSNIIATIVIKYEIITTRFDQYGQVSKTFKRVLIK